ncbi:kinase-like domain-containing protein [Mycena belliarum]|uniref:Kinase-like domain-containing protein n=1 Tax=Mycena belliarum TaxID=1033014 RepID=A0AAD6U443_9AGAR|nr:kinase-like domain-containing protein [Mycena belliae]
MPSFHFTAIASCLRRPSLTHLHRARCEALRAIQQTVQRFAAGVVFVAKIIANPSSLVIRPPATRTARLDIPASPTYPQYAPPLALYIVLAFFGSMTILLLAYTLRKTRLAVSVNTAVRKLVNNHVHIVKSSLAVIFVALPQCVAVSTSKLYKRLERGTNLFALYLSTRIRRASIAAWLLPGSIILNPILIDAYGRILAVVVVNILAGLLDYRGLIDFTLGLFCSGWLVADTSAFFDLVLAVLSSKAACGVVATEISRTAGAMGYGDIVNLLFGLWVDKRQDLSAIAKVEVCTPSAEEPPINIERRRSETSSRDTASATSVSKVQRTSSVYGSSIGSVSSDSLSDSASDVEVKVDELWTPPHTWRSVPRYRCELDPGDLQVGAHIASGGFGQVFEVEGPTDSPLALKRLRKRRGGLDEEDTYIELCEELDIQLHLMDHPAFPTVYGVFEDDNHYIVIMDRGTKCLIDEEVMDVELALSWAAQLIIAVQHMHRRGVIHCDIKPENILIDENSNLVIIDYGISERFALKSPMDATNDRVPVLWAGPENPYTALVSSGTRRFRSPAADLGPCSFGADLFAVGVTLHWLLTGLLPAFTESQRWLPNRKPTGKREPLTNDQCSFLHRAASQYTPFHCKLGTDYPLYPVFPWPASQYTRFRHCQLGPDYPVYPFHSFLFPPLAERSPTPPPVEVDKAVLTTGTTSKSTIGSRIETEGPARGSGAAMKNV